MTPNLHSMSITPEQALLWAHQNGIHDLPGDMRWQLCHCAQCYPVIPDACYLYAGDEGLYGIVGFRANTVAEVAAWSEGMVQS